MKSHSNKCGSLKQKYYGDARIELPYEEGKCDCDGYHTFDELYDHRITLFIALCRIYADTHVPREVWRSKKHADGSMFDGWFVMGIKKDAGQQMTYHLPLERWNETDFAQTMEHAPAFDGHTPDDVIGRLKAL